MYYVKVTFSIKRPISDILKYCKIVFKEYVILDKGYTLEATLLKEYYSVDGRSILFTYLDVYAKYITNMILWSHKDASNQT